VELKVYQSKYSTTSWNEIVPNVPCGVERLFGNGQSVITLSQPVRGYVVF